MSGASIAGLPLEVTMSNIRARIERLERGLSMTPDGPRRINWDNLWKRPEDMVPDGVIDWEAFCRPRKPWSAEDCPIERAIREVGRPAPEQKDEQSKDLG